MFVQSESSEYFHPETPGAVAGAELYNEQRFLGGAVVGSGGIFGCYVLTRTVLW